MKIAALTAALAVASGFAAACQSTPSAPYAEPLPYYADGRARDFIVMRDAVLYVAPREDSPETGLLRRGERIRATYSHAEPAWMRLELDGRRVFVFGDPLYPEND